MAVEIIAVSPRMRRAVELAERVAAAPSASSFLIAGESGTGKDLLARFVHERGGTGGALVAISCGALPDTLLESELFGHERGAFTGATEAQPGRLEAARGGTLVLDEIGMLTPAAQAKLLRVLDERRFRRLGGSREIELEARVVALTNVDLAGAVAAGHFRPDLYFRIDVVRVELPPLREQPEAVKPLAEAFARRSAGPEGGAANGRARVSPAALHLLEAYRWPGNVRELRNVIEQARIAGAGDLITPAHLPAQVTSPPPSGPRRRTLADVEEEYIRSVLAEVRGNKSSAARILGISRKNLYERLERMGAGTRDLAGDER